MGKVFRLYFEKKVCSVDGNSLGEYRVQAMRAPPAVRYESKQMVAEIGIRILKQVLGRLVFL